MTPESLICTRDDEHPRPFHIVVPLGFKLPESKAIPTSLPGSLILPSRGALWGGKMRDPGNEVEAILQCFAACQVSYFREEEGTTIF